MVPLFKEQAHSTAMMKPSLSIIPQEVDHLNHNQVPVVTVDQPLYAISKKVQWILASKLWREKICFILFGGLHIELNALKALGKKSG